jgi:hypothetical protein
MASEQSRIRFIVEPLRDLLIFSLPNLKTSNDGKLQPNRKLARVLIGIA